MSQRRRSLQRYFLGTILLAVTNGIQTVNKELCMIDARIGDILTSFEANAVSDLNACEKEEELLCIESQFST